MATIAAVAVGGCSPNHSLLDALASKYQGFEELSPKLSPGATGAAFPYTPGTIIPAFAVAGDSEQRTWVATTDLRCGPDVPLKSLRYWQRRAHHSHYGQMARADAKAWLEKRTGSGAASLAGVTEVIVDVSAVRSYEPVRDVLHDLNLRAASGCILPVSFGDGAIRRVRGVIIGNVRVRLHFEQGFDLMAQAQLADQLSFALGLGFQRISENEIVGRDIAFGVKWQ